VSILFDQGTPVLFRRLLKDCSLVTASEQGWIDLSNGDLLVSAEDAGFDVIVTADRNLRYRQNFA